MRARPIGAIVAMLLAAVPLAARGDESCLFGHVAYVDAAVKQAIDHLSDMGLDKAGEAALERLYQNALKNTPQWPVGAIDTTFTSSRDAALLKDSPWAKVLTNLTKVRDGVIRPLEALDAGDEAAAWQALGEFALDLGSEKALAAKFGEGAAGLITVAAKFAYASRQALKQEECLLATDLEFYNATMHDPKLAASNKAIRVDHYLSAYLTTFGNAPSGYPREEHRRRLQCYIDTELSPEERTIAFGTTYGQRTPFDRAWDTFRALNARGNQAANRALRTAVGAMLHDFDARRQWEDAKAKLRIVRQSPDFQAVADLLAKIGDPEKVASNFCEAYERALAAMPPPGQQTTTDEKVTEETATLGPASIKCDFALCKAEGPPQSLARDACLAAAARRWQSVEPCRRAADPAACAAPTLLQIGDPDLVRAFVSDAAQRDALLGALLIKGSNREGLPHIVDNERHDTGVLMAAILWEDWTAGNAPPANWCDQMRSNYQGDYPGDAIMHRNQCEAVVAAQHALAGGADRCGPILRQRVRAQSSETLEEAQTDAVNLCHQVLDTVANNSNLSPSQQQRRVWDLMRGDSARPDGEFALPDLADSGLDPAGDPAIGGSVPDDGDGYAWCGRGKEPVITLDNPTVDGEALDICETWGVNCWKPAADSWCRKQGYGEAVSFRTAGGKRTKIPGDGKICEGYHCRHFAKINCAASPAVEGSLPPPNAPLCPLGALGPGVPLDQSRYLVIGYFGGATHFYRHRTEAFLCGYGSIHTSDFIGQYLYEEGGGFGLYELVGDDMKLIWSLTKTEEGTDDRGRPWMRGTSRSADGTKTGAWGGHWETR